MRAFVTLLVIVAVVFVFYRGWLQFNVTDKTDETQTTLTIDKTKIKSDLDSLKSQHEAVAKPNDEFAETTIHGRLQTVGQNFIIVRTDAGHDAKVHLVPETAIHVGSKIGSVSDLHVGDQVSAQQVNRDSRLVASSVDVGQRVS